ncbi:MAG: DMT family transporter [Terriglobales bacterium]
MRKFYIIGFLILTVFDTLGQIAFKLAGTHAAPAELTIGWLARLIAEPWVYLAVVGYIGAFFTWMTLLKHAPIGPAFAASHLHIVAVVIVSVGWLAEKLSPGQILGCLLVVAGVVLFGQAETEEHQVAPQIVTPGESAADAAHRS